VWYNLNIAREINSRLSAKAENIMARTNTAVSTEVQTEMPAPVAQSFNRENMRGLALDQALVMKDPVELTAYLLASPLFKGDAAKAKSYATVALREHAEGKTTRSSKSNVPAWLLGLSSEQLAELKDAWDMMHPVAK
jgi:hypothetical protein